MHMRVQFESVGMKSFEADIVPYGELRDKDSAVLGVRFNIEHARELRKFQIYRKRLRYCATWAQPCVCGTQASRTRTTT